MESLQLREQTAKFWREFYARHNLRHDPSPFALWCLQSQLTAKNCILELGCGNGRDSFAFMHHGLTLLAVDGCDLAIADNIEHYNQRIPQASGQFHALNFVDLAKLIELSPQAIAQTDTVYSRFVLHAIPEDIEDIVLDFCDRLLARGGRMLHEFRTIRDPLMEQGEILSPHERLTDHYRRFIDPEVFLGKLMQRGWKVIFFTESKGLAKLGDDDPVVARVVAEKRG
ncbi:class I SAM-dependent methyltransferase [Allochromatium humboldtianum]|uniref:Class I SAM-dependent methyltransferase n=1 Tax=Allochromatium humboldtianum TaxID=504901 RepID=A0A850RH56_9GAMM|nr:class I SAM-dependent methyltransferase [Allochromatium humboldtianum]NVZ10747.1 class I SAM-dependent methyltransferase [Allochromatium humboldtianum]